jgi:dephospho-CoA kinase
MSPFIVAVTGGIGAGKSRVAETFRRLGAHVIDADKIARRVVGEAEVRSELEREFGAEIFTDQGSLDRKALAELVFSDPGSRARLEAITHPRVRQRIDKELADLATNGSDGRSPLPGKRPLVLLDIPLLETSPYHGRADFILFIDAPESDRRRRVRETRGWSVEEWSRRESSQVQLADKRRRAHQILPNPDVEEERLEERCRALIEEWRRGMISGTNEESPRV